MDLRKPREVKCWAVEMKIATLCCFVAIAAALPPVRVRKPPLRGGSLQRRLEVGSYFGVWYALNVLYNIENKKVLRIVDLPWTIAVSQLLVGAAYSQCAWCFRKRPKDLVGAMRDARWLALFHGAGQACTVIALGAGAVSSAHVIKALEPLFSAVFSALVERKLLSPAVYASLLPVVGGVGLAVAKDLQFSLLSFVAAMGSNVFFAGRAVFSKRAMHGRLSRLSPASLFGVVTTAAAIAMLPLALLVEGRYILDRVNSALATTAPLRLLGLTLASGLFHYLNNEVMYLTLGKVHPITLAVGNTLKRVVIILASLAVLGETMTPLAAAGASVAIAGTGVYSLLKQRG